MGFLSEEASTKRSKSALFGYFMSMSGSVFSIGLLIVSITQFSKPNSRPDLYFALGAIGLATSSALAGVATVAENSKQQTELLRVIASTKN